MSTFTGGALVLSRQKVSRVCLIVISMVVYGLTPGALGQTPGGAVPKEDPWQLVQTQQTPISFEIPKAADRQFGGPVAQVDAFELDIEPRLVDGLGPELVAELRALIESKHRDGPATGFAISDMQQVADAVTEFLRATGFIVAYAYIPAQDVENNRVTLAVLSGTLGEVVVQGNTILSSERISLPFKTLRDRPIKKHELDTAMVKLRDYPGVQPAFVLSAGDQVGTTDLTVRVNEWRSEFSVIGDNYGSEQTGESRGRIRFNWNNPLKMGDQLTLNLLQTFNPADGTFGGVQYKLPFGDSGFSMGAVYDENSFDFTSGLLELSGESETATIFARQRLVKSRERTIELQLDLATKRASFEAAGDKPEDAISVASLRLYMSPIIDRIFGGRLGVNSLNLGYHHGLPDFLGSMDEDGIGENGEISTRRGGSGELAGGNFDKYTVRYQRLQSVTPTTELTLRLFGQWTDDLLTSIEKMSLGGRYNVRAYPTAEILVDRGGFGSVEYGVNTRSIFKSLPEDGELKLSLFFDYAWGRTLDPLTSEAGTAKLGGFGVGMQYRYLWGVDKQLSVRLEIASPTTSLDASNERDPQYWLHLEYTNRR